MTLYSNCPNYFRSNTVIALKIDSKHSLSYSQFMLLNYRFIPNFMLYPITYQIDRLLNKLIIYAVKQSVRSTHGVVIFHVFIIHLAVLEIPCSYATAIALLLPYLACICHDS
jgi:hypothetical protein